ncbi:MAG TPA: hypothetical protein PKC76_04015 [Saprospiraceae bacterium]|nr:hypothetical protein [Saprospiraceae bacterium]HMP23268.1 hypothetical protein [Saprospiraceae bacterium]
MMPYLLPSNKKLSQSTSLWIGITLVASLLTACELTREYDGDLFPFEGHRLACFAVFNNEQAIQVFIFSTVHPLDTSRAMPVVNAEVDLYVDGSFRERLEFTENRFESPSRQHAEPGRRYHFAVRAEGFPDAWSEPVSLPDAPQPEIREWGYSADSSRVWATLDVAAAQAEGFVFGLLSRGYRNGILIRDQLPISFDTEAIPIAPNVIRQTVSMPRRVIVFRDFVPSDTIILDKIEIRAALFSDHWERFNASRPDSDLGGFFPPEARLYSNISGGYGVAGAYSAATVYLDLH